MRFISEFDLRARLSAGMIFTTAMLVLVSGLACREMQVRGELIFGPSLRSESDQVLGMPVVLAYVEGWLV